MPENRGLFEKVVTKLLETDRRMFISTIVGIKGLKLGEDDSNYVRQAKAEGASTVAVRNGFWNIIPPNITAVNFSNGITIRRPGAEEEIIWNEEEIKEYVERAKGWRW